MKRRTFMAGAAALAAARATEGELFAGDDEQQQAWREKLGRHRLKSIDTGGVQMQWPRLVGKNARLDVHGRGPRVSICRLVTDGGAGGWGAARGGEKAARDAFEKCQGKPLAELFDPAQGIAIDALAPLDFALHDLAGQILEIPVYRMLGGTGTMATPCYSGMIYFDDLEPPDNPAGIAKVLENCRFDVDHGYRQLKVKIGRGNRWMKKDQGLARDIEVTQEIHRRFPEIRILVDGNNGFAIDEIVRYLEGIGEIDLLWIEEPFHENVKDYARLNDWLTKHARQTYLADGEADPDWPVLNELSEKKLLDVQLVDVVGYGFTAWRKLMPTLTKLGVLASPHAWGDALKTNYTAHLAAGLGNVVTIEGVTCKSPDVNFGQYKLEDGKLTVSDDPGFGMKLIG